MLLLLTEIFLIESYYIRIISGDKIFFQEMKKKYFFDTQIILFIHFTILMFSLKICL